MMVKVGQVYASNRKADRDSRKRQQRRVMGVSGGFVWLRSEWKQCPIQRFGPTTCVRIRDDITSQSIPGYRLVKDVS